MRKGTMRGRGEHSEAIAIEVGEDLVGEREASSLRARLLDVVPLAWLDQLLFATLELPLLRGECDVVESLVNSVAAILPSFAVGACVPEQGATQGEPSIVKRLPPGTRERTTGADPTRIFPGKKEEKK